jgi:hypothetical protein
LDIDVDVCGCKKNHSNKTVNLNSPKIHTLVISNIGHKCANFCGSESFGFLVFSLHKKFHLLKTAKNSYLLKGMIAHKVSDWLLD